MTHIPYGAYKIISGLSPLCCFFLIPFVCLPAELGGSHQSSPHSKAGSHAPLLRRANNASGQQLQQQGQPQHQGGELFKFPSGVSAVSSHDNPIYDTQDSGYTPVGDGSGAAAAAASGSTLQSVLPLHVGGWELQSQLLTQQQRADGGAAAAAAAAAAPAASKGRGGELGGILAAMEMRGATGGVKESGFVQGWCRCWLAQ